jgi:hypothetical protein
MINRLVLMAFFCLSADIVKITQVFQLKNLLVRIIVFSSIIVSAIPVKAESSFLNQVNAAREEFVSFCNGDPKLKTIVLRPYNENIKAISSIVVDCGNERSRYRFDDRSEIQYDNSGYAQDAKTAAMDLCSFSNRVLKVPFATSKKPKRTGGFEINCVP